MEEQSEHVCVLCRQSYTSERELVDHSVKVHCIKTLNKFHCGHCNKNFRDSYNLRRHVGFLHSSKPEAVEPKYTRCVLCSKHYEKKVISKHFSAEHNISLVEEELEFDSNESFEKWKTQIENSTKSRYVKVRNVYKYKNGSTLNTFYCHRDGFVKNSKSKNLRRTKSFGSNKINGHCPSKMVVKCDTNGCVKVKFVKTHIGHDAELKRTCLNKKEKEELAVKLSENVPFDQILDDIRDSIKDSDLKRVHLLSKQDLRNIVRDFKVKKHETDSPDSTNLEVALETIFAFDSSVIRIYKPRGSVSHEFPQLKPKDYLLLVMNDIQKDMLEKFGNSFLCIDLTHGIHLHDLDMYTIFIINDLQQAFPCAFGFSNRCDLVAMELFLYGLQDIMKGVINPNLLVTNELLHDAWSAVMGAPPSFIYCPWLVDLDWRNNLKKIHDKEKQTVIYKQLRKLLEEKDIELFNRNMDEFYFHLEYDNDTKDFLNYFEKYKNTSEKWAKSHINNFQELICDLEKLHKSLKYIYLKRKKVHNIDDTIISLMSFLRDKYLVQPISTVSEKLMEVKIGHNAAINMNQANLTKINDISWDVCDSIHEETYRVEQVKTRCDDCILTCKPCSGCIHLHNCSCYESAVKWNMCQHIHLVCIVAQHERSIALSKSIDQPNKIVCNEQSSDCDSGSITFAGNESDSESLTIIHHISSPSKNSLELEIKKKEILRKFTHILENATCLEQLDFINKQLNPCEQEICGMYEKLHKDDNSTFD